MVIRAASRLPCPRSKRQRSTPVAFSEKSAKLTPSPSHVAPRGYGAPGQTRIEGGGSGDGGRGGTALISSPSLTPDAWRLDVERPRPIPRTSEERDREATFRRVRRRPPL